MSRQVRLLGTLSLLLGLTVVFLVVPSSAIFLDAYGAPHLAFVYLGVAVVGLAVSRVLNVLQSRLSLTAVAAWSIGAYCAVVVIGWGLLRVGGPGWVSAAERLVVLLDPHAESAALAGPLRADAERTAADWVEELVTDSEGFWGDPWLRACAIHAAPSVLGTPGAVGAIRAWVDDEDPTVAETARWVSRDALL